MANRITPPDVKYNDVTFAGGVTFGGEVNLPAGTIDNADISASAAIAYTKVIGERCTPHEIFAEGASVIALASKLIHIVRGTSGTQVGLDAVIGSSMTSPSSISVDLQKGTIGSSVFASVLTTPINLGATSNLFTRYSATFATTGLPMLVGETYRLVVTVAGTTASASKGLLVTHTYAEAPA